MFQSFLWLRHNRNILRKGRGGVVIYSRLSGAYGTPSGIFCSFPLVLGGPRGTCGGIRASCRGSFHTTCGSSRIFSQDGGDGICAGTRGSFSLTVSCRRAYGQGGRPRTSPWILSHGQDGAYGIAWHIHGSPPYGTCNRLSGIGASYFSSLPVSSSFCFILRYFC